MIDTLPYCSSLSERLLKIFYKVTSYIIFRCDKILIQIF